MISGIVTAILLVAFLGLIGWAWSARRKADFRDASRLPLDDDHHDRSHANERDLGLVIVVLTPAMSSR